jgi:hypothetical protein
MKIPAEAHGRKAIKYTFQIKSFRFLLQTKGIEEGAVKMVTHVAKVCNMNKLLCRFFTIRSLTQNLPLAYARNAGHCGASPHRFGLLQPMALDLRSGRRCHHLLEYTQFTVHIPGQLQNFAGIRLRGADEGASDELPRTEKFERYVTREFCVNKAINMPLPSPAITKGFPGI